MCRTNYRKVFSEYNCKYAISDIKTSKLVSTEVDRKHDREVNNIVSSMEDGEYEQNNLFGRWKLRTCRI